MEGTTRRKAIRNGLLVVAGTVSAGAIGTRSAAAASPLSSSAVRSFTLFGRGLTSVTADGLSGHAVQRGDRLASEGRLLDAPDGEPVGTFYSAAFVLRHLGAAPGDAASLELHTFELTDGTIMGSGTASSTHRGVFAVLGGTGRYVGAAGSYVAEQDPADVSTGGTATFVFTLVR